jgi:hypothetical protein
MAKKRSSKKNQAAEAQATDVGAVASQDENAQLQHTDDLRNQAEIHAASAAGVPLEPLHEEGRSMTTRDDRLDLGVTMLPGSPEEPSGPEDALGQGPKRGDYTERIGPSDYQPHEGAEPQRPRAAEIGDAEGQKGGVTTAGGS